MRAGFLLFQDRATVIFYSNDLKDTLSQRISSSDNPHAVHCVPSLDDLPRWMEHECLKKTTLSVPAIIMAYNLFMNAEYRVDQVRASSAMMRKEHRVSMSLFCFILDPAIQNAFALYRCLGHSNFKTFREFKRNIDEQLVLPQIKSNKQRSILRLVSSNESAGDGQMLHVLLENVRHSSTANVARQCYLCKHLNINCNGKSTSIFSCSICKVAFHVNCFTLYNYHKHFKSNEKRLFEEIDGLRNGDFSSSKRHKTIGCSSNIQNAAEQYMKNLV